MKRKISVTPRDNYPIDLSEISENNENMNREDLRLREVRERFVAEWGAMGSQWGINRTMAQIHALLMTASEPMSTDDVMEALEISRGNAHGNLKELLSWGLLKTVVVRGSRKEYFIAEKDVWKIFTIVTRERKRREIDPAVVVLSDCARDSEGMSSEEGKQFHEQMRQLEEFVAFASSVADRVGSMKHGFAVQLAAKVFA